MFERKTREGERERERGRKGGRERGKKKVHKNSKTGNESKLSKKNL